MLYKILGNSGQFLGGRSELSVAFSLSQLTVVSDRSLFPLSFQATVSGRQGFYACQMSVRPDAETLS